MYFSGVENIPPAGFETQLTRVDEEADLSAMVAMAMHRLLRFSRFETISTLTRLLNSIIAQYTSV